MREGETEVKPGWVLSLRVWWAFMWRIILISSVIGPVFNYLIVIWGDKSDFLYYLLMFLGGAVILFGDIWVMHTLLQKRFGNYRITVFKAEAGSKAS